jgi:DMSO/TMAO reductase YedYZ molybdopterin-dependent catalytic subunit
MLEETRIDRGHRLLVGVGLAGAMLLFAGCAAAPPAAPASLAEAKQAIEVAEKADASHFAAAELDEARQKLIAANKAVTAENIILADRLALESAATAELATARTEATKAAAINEEFRRGVEALTEEMRRTGDQQ